MSASRQSASRRAGATQSRLRMALVALVVAAPLIAMPAVASAATYTTPASTSVSFGPLKVKGYQMTGVVRKSGRTAEFDLFLSGSSQTVYMSTTKGTRGVSLSLAKDLSKGTVKANLGKKYGGFSLAFKATKSLKTIKPSKGCSGKNGKSRVGALKGSFKVKLGDSYFKTITAKKFKGQAFSSPKQTCKFNGGGGGQSKDTVLSGGTKKLFVSITKTPSGHVTEQADSSEGSGGVRISRTISIGVPSSYFAVAGVSSATAKGKSPLKSPLSGTLHYVVAGSIFSYYKDGSSGTLSGDFRVAFVGMKIQKPFAGGKIFGSLQRPGFAPPDQPPHAAFGIAFQAPGTTDVVFDASESYDPDGPITSYAWNFGDGQAGAGPNPTHHYGAAGSYQVTLTVTNSSIGRTTTQTTTQVTHAVTVIANAKPTASFQVLSIPPFSVSAGTNAVGFEDTSQDTDGSIVTLSWDFGDPGSGAANTAGTESPTSHEYANPGLYTVTLTVTDNGGATDTTTRTVQIDP